VHFLLYETGCTREQAILIPTSDEMAMLVADNAELLRQRFIFPVNSPALVHGLCDKGAMYGLAKACGIPTATTEFPKCRNDVLQYLQTAAFPVMVKGIDGNLLEARTDKKMVIVHTEEELLQAYDNLEDPLHPNLMLQEYIPGGEDTVWMFNGYFNGQSECLAGYTGKKIRQNPVYTGMTSLGVCLKNKTVEETTKQFMKVLGYRGILDIGYRYDERDGLYKVLDVNPRIGATFRLFTADNGMDVVRALYLDLTEQPVNPGSCREGRKWLVEDKDLRSSYRYAIDGRLKFGEWVSSFHGVEEAGYFSWDDLLPFFAMAALHIKKLFKQLRNGIQRVEKQIRKQVDSIPSLSKDSIHAIHH
ncbi:MAG TPA: hypothetical protein VKS81_01740, partial [Bacteroidota bacterium]|nr:hypothetical protein [Bacteroidota bacterium]